MGSDAEVIFSADDFGLTDSVNEAVERAHLEGALTQASLMVAAPAAADAVARARRLPSLNVGLHLVLVEGDSVLGHTALPTITGADGRFGADQIARGFRYFFSPAARRELAAEIRAQFEAFAATGLTLHHADSHKHMHMHPTVASLMIRIGREFGLRRIRVPAEPPAVLRASGDRPGFPAHALYAWSRVIRAQASRAGLSSPDHILGIRRSGHMTPERVNAYLEVLPSGSTEIYFHPATRRCRDLERLMPDYEHVAEFEALCAIRDRA
ncbi:hopanoid biosynthesis-associated protein HpnK [Acidiphilium sp.]|uniref:hopanoid biosynthesis-associated protein HpnK n=1 Tax=Acidiphilium sp. TaxID=527 RepID=UPI0025911F72|nr:hopanoid biosynthesis-associated protein HpnK [Acidiphilium sp.]